MIQSKSSKAFNIISNSVLMTFALLALIPFLLLVIASITSEGEILRTGYSLFPKEFSFAAYNYIWQERAQIGQAYIITVFVTIVGTAVSLAITSMIAYPLSRKDLPFVNIVAFLIFFTMLFNGGLVPSYLLWTQVFKIKNTVFALIIPGLLMNGFNIMLMRTYFSSNIPGALIEAASIDGASEFLIYRKIILPLSKPIITTVMLFVCIMYWNDWTNGLYYINDPKLFSVQNLLNRMLTDIQFLASNSSFSSNSSNAVAKLPSSTIRMAIAVIGILPILIVYPFMQRNFIKGLTVGSVKG